MSSYITSPYMLEQRRLQGIVNQCEANLNRAVQDVVRQQQLMEQQKENQRRKDEQYSGSLAESEAGYQRQAQQSHENTKKRKEHLREMLRNIQIEMEALQGGTEDLSEAKERQKRLMFRLEHAGENLDELEKSIISHMQETEREMGQQSSLQQGDFVSEIESQRPQMRQGIKGISRQMEQPKSAAAGAEESPLHIFTYKLQAAMESPYASRFPSLAQLQKELDGKPEYAKAAFAVNSMKKLEEILKQIGILEQNKKSDLEKREKIVLQYKAVCQLMQVEPDEALLADKKSTRMLGKLCSDMYAEYQESQKRKYVSDAIADVMGRHGIAFQDSMRSASGKVMRFAMDHARVDVSGTESDRLVMEVTGEYTGDAPTLNDRRKSVSSAHQLCSLMKTIEMELKEEYGIIFGTILAERPSEEAIVMEQKGRGSEERRYTGKKKAMSDTF